MSLSEISGDVARSTPRAFTWDADSTELVRSMVRNNETGSAIQAATGAPDLGFVYRKLESMGLRLNRKVSAERRMVRHAFSGPPTGTVAPGIHELPQEPSDAAVSLADLDPGRCRWPISGERLDMMFCGERADHSYCARHHNIAYRGRRNV